MSQLSETCKNRFNRFNRSPDNRIGGLQKLKNRAMVVRLK